MNSSIFLWYNKSFHPQIETVLLWNIFLSCCTRFVMLTKQTVIWINYWVVRSRRCPPLTSQTSLRSKNSLQTSNAHQFLWNQEKTHVSCSRVFFQLTSCFAYLSTKLALTCKCRSILTYRLLLLWPPCCFQLAKARCEGKGRRKINNNFNKSHENSTYQKKFVR